MPVSRNRKVRSKSGPPRGNTIKGDWWRDSEKGLHDRVWPLIQVLRNEQRQRDFFNRLFYSMFVGHHASGLEGDRYATHHSGGEIRVNLARAIASAANSKLAKNKVRVLYLTEGGDWSQQARSKRITKVVNGTLHSSGFYEQNANAQRDSAIFDLGAVYFYTENNKVKCERVPGNEIRVDYMDGRYGTPSSLHREVTVPRSTVLAMYPEKEKSIKSATLALNSTRAHGSQWIADCVDLVYSWHLPSGPEENDGLFAVTISNDTLEMSEYKHDYFPFVFHRWEQNPYGFYGQSICHILAGIQFSIDRVVKDIQEHVDLSTGFVAVESGSGLNKQAMVNEPWPIYEYTGIPPQHVIPPALSMEKVEWLNWLINRGHEDTGLSQLFVTSRKPDGLDSGKALREYQDQNSERFQMAQQRFENSHVDAAKIITGLYEEIYEESGEFDVRAYGSKNIETINWEKARMDEEDYVVRPVPTSFLPSTPAAKLQTIQEMLQGGMLGREEAMLLLDYPDLEKVNSLQTAPLLNIEWRLEQLLDPDEPRFIPPDPTMNLPLAMKMATSAYNDAQANGAPEENLALLERFMVAISDLMDRASPPPEAPPPGEMPPDMAAEPVPGAMQQ